MTPRALLGLSVGLSFMWTGTALAADPSLPPLEGGPASSTPAPPGAAPTPAPTAPPTGAPQPAAPQPAAPQPAAPQPAAPQPAAPQPAAPPPAASEQPAATAPAPDEPPPPVYEAESEFPEPETHGEGDELDGYAAAPEQTKAEGKKEYGRNPWEINVGLGGGNAAGDHDWPVHGAFAMYFGGGYRFVPHFSAGLELAAWSYAVEPDALADEIDITSGYIALYGRWYWFDKGKLDPYLMAGFGLSVFGSQAKHDEVPHSETSQGWALPVGIGVDWQLGKVFRLGPQALVYWHHATNFCTRLVEDGDQVCRDPDRNDLDDRDGDALPWRVTINGTFTLGSR